MLVKDLQKGTIVYCMPYIVADDYTNNGLEIYEFRSRTYFRGNINTLSFNTILGLVEYYLILPTDVDLDSLILVYHDPECLWVYTANEQKMVEYWNNYLSNKELPKFTEMWNEEELEWKLLM